MEEVVRSDGVTVTGTAEAGAAVVFAINGNTYDAAASDTGAWSVDVAAEQPRNLAVTAEALDQRRGVPAILHVHVRDPGGEGRG